IAGVLLGLAFLSKYFAALLAIALACDVVLAPRGERPWRGLAVTFAGALPFVLLNLWWNYEHCWSNLMFNLYNRHEDAGLSWRSPLIYLLVLAYVLSPPAIAQLAGRNAAWRTWWSRRGLRFFAIACAVPLGAFLLLSAVRGVGLHWVLAFVPFFFMAAALALPAARLRQSLAYLGGFSLLHLALILAGSVLPVETWKFSRLYDGIVFHVRIAQVVRALESQRPEFEIAADGYSPAATASYYSGRYVFVFGAASSHARHDDLLTDFRALEGRNILVFRKSPPEPHDYEPYFRSVEYRSLELSGATFHLVLGRQFDYRAYREGVILPVLERYYRIPRYLPQGACIVCERYLGAHCPVRG
ncbi:MAG: glycosyl transferase family 39, partial [Burkholderiales bacterium]|nr:glycosyl transferase family 39 [Burkholderiales bacterium]